MSLQLAQPSRWAARPGRRQRDRDTLGDVDAAADRLLGSQLSLGGAEPIGIG